MILGVGVDSVLISRVASKLSDTFVKRFLKPEERVYFDKLVDPYLRVDYVAKLWAIKESCVKAWPHPASIFHFTIFRTGVGYELIKPNDYNCKISVTNDKDSIVAICVIESKDR